MGVASNSAFAPSLPAAWSLAWCEDGELAQQDRFDLLQTLVATESHEVQVGLIVALETLGVGLNATVAITAASTALCA
ncbi:hypothetical protein [Cyanobium sp. WAJ14-Wanaka]|uniref:hypothetical protein n=1 Tax=Cyanobium sp. WAJ14-Wanaka TaxID=2823725 RepID=UPI0020CF7FB2|nr:hypothetical protein [Cyanobium sp. WAJ14-Wanaka]MCP9774263.1 hypothetical protein [Cyanobium sp. WAJ14-Wanaka]